jgi:hypothetical protein
MGRLRDKYVSDAKGMIKEDAALAAGRRIAGGDFSAANIFPIIHWKSSRTLPLIKSNRDAEISDALGLAVSAKTPRAAMATLRGLRGVDVPVASAILTTINPERYTVIDRRALATLGVRRSTPTIDDYLIYLEFCTAKAAEFSVSLRDLDRALWQAADYDTASA